MNNVQDVIKFHTTEAALEYAFAKVSQMATKPMILEFRAGFFETAAQLARHVAQRGDLPDTLIEVPYLDDRVWGSGATPGYGYGAHLAWAYCHHSAQGKDGLAYLTALSNMTGTVRMVLSEVEQVKV